MSSRSALKLSIEQTFGSDQLPVGTPVGNSLPESTGELLDAGRQIQTGRADFQLTVPRADIEAVIGLIYGRARAAELIGLAQRHRATRGAEREMLESAIRAADTTPNGGVPRDNISSDTYLKMRDVQDILHNGVVTLSHVGGNSERLEAVYRFVTERHGGQYPRVENTQALAAASAETEVASPMPHEHKWWRQAATESKPKSAAVPKGRLLAAGERKVGG